MNNKTNTKTKLIKYEDDKEAVMIRVDKTAQEMMEEKPSSRWDSNYWHVKYDELFKILRNNPTEYLDKFRSEITSGYRSGGVSFLEQGVPYLQVRNILDTGIDLVDVDLISEESPAATDNKKVLRGDILLNRSGTGSVGRMTVFLRKDKKCYVGGHVYRFSTKKLSPIYINVILKTLYCKSQIHRFESGVSGKTELDLEEILHIEIPILSEDIQKTIKNKYLEMFYFHKKAMMAKMKKNKKEYKSNLQKAQSLLESLICQTEEIIRGEKEKA